MDVEDYRVFITRIKTLEAEAGTLRQILDRERASFDVYMAAVASADEARLRERAETSATIDYLTGEIRGLKRRRYYPGITFGVGPSINGDGVRFFGGIGWKIPIF